MTRLQKIMAGSMLSGAAVLAVAAAPQVQHQVQHRSESPAVAARATRTAPAIVDQGSARDTAGVHVISLMAPKPITSNESYSVLMRRSIFSKDHKASGFHSDELIVRKASPESTLVFRGAMKEGTRYVASIEDTDAKKALWFHDGETLSEGTLIREIALDHLIVEKHGSRKRVDLGESMEGTPVSLAESAPVTTAAAAPATTASSNETALGSSIQEMMRQRRLRQLSAAK